MENQGRALVPHRGQRNDVALNAAPESREIVVNGRRHIIEGASIGYDQLVRLAYPDMGDAGKSAMTITYRGGPLHAAEGLLTKHQRTPVVQGETFVVGHTIAS